MKGATAAARIRAMLRRAAYGKATAEEVAEETGLTKFTVEKELRRMKDTINLNQTDGGRGKKGLWGLRGDTEGLTQTQTPLKYRENGMGFSPLRGETQLTQTQTETNQSLGFEDELPF